MNEASQPIVIYGASGFGREVLQLILDINESGGGSWDVQGFVDDDPDLEGSNVGGLPVLGNRERLLSQVERPAVALGFGAPHLKLRIQKELRSAGFSFPILAHPTAVIGERVHLGKGSIICAGSIITCDVRVGEFVTINLACTIGHDAEVGDWATLAPGVHVSGFVRVGQGAEIGTGAAIIQGINVGEWSVMGAGAVAARNVTANSVTVGVPAKPIKQRDSGWQHGR